MIVTNRRLVAAIGEQLPELPAAALVGEPCKRDTAPCIGLAALLVSRDDPDATMVVMPADHVIRPAEKFQAAIREAAALVAESPGRIVTFGIKPTYPAEIFGYIHRGQPIDQPPRRSARVRRQQLQGEAQRRNRPQVRRVGRVLLELRHLRLAGQHDSRRPRRSASPRCSPTSKRSSPPGTRAARDAVFEREFTAIKGISIDYAVMEHATNVAVIEAPFDWDDLGSWQSLGRARAAPTPTATRSSAATSASTPRARSSAPTTTTWWSRSASKDMHRRPHAERDAGGQQARRRKDPADREGARNAGLDRISVSGHASIRIAGIDYGTVRIGIATADTEVGIAGPYENYNRRTPALDAEYFKRLAKEERIGRFVVGLPVHLSGSESQKSTRSPDVWRMARRA